MADTIGCLDAEGIPHIGAGPTIAQAVELKNYLKEKYQIEPAAGAVAAAAPAAAAVAAAPAAEVTEFTVVLEAGFEAAKKVNIIKAVRVAQEEMKPKVAVE